MANQDDERLNPISGQGAGTTVTRAGLSDSGGQRPANADASDSFSPAEKNDNLKQAGERVADEVKQSTKEMAGRAKEQGRSMLEEQKNSAAGKFDTAAHAFRNTATQLQAEGEPQVGRYVNMLAGQFESLGGRLRQKNLDGLIHDAENLGRRSPVAFMAGSVIAGFALARFLKSSTRHRYDSTGETSRQMRYNQSDRQNFSGSHADDMSQPRSGRNASDDTGMSARAADGDASFMTDASASGDSDKSATLSNSTSAAQTTGGTPHDNR